jgi:hypothetical protein
MNNKFNNINAITTEKLTKILGRKRGSFKITSNPTHKNGKIIGYI